VSTETYQEALKENKQDNNWEGNKQDNNWEENKQDNNW